MPIIEIYPDCPKPKWLKRGAKCFCLGEGSDVFTIDTVFEKSATLTKGRYAHGMESFSKLYQSLPEINRRLNKERKS